MRTLVLAGRRIDPAGASRSSFPGQAVGLVAEGIRRLLADERVEALVASGACGADLVAHAEAGRAGLRRRMVLPFAPARFRATSVVDRPATEGWDWGRLFDRIATELTAAGDLIVHHRTAAYAAVNMRLIDEAAALAAPGAPLAAVVWEGTARGSGDHTADFLRLACERGLVVHELPSLPS
jgi:hypothetical protein